MANPTGTTYMQANNNYVWQNGDVYEIVWTDMVEGAATGASFAGLGVANQPHQILLNKVNLLQRKQLQDEGNIAALQAFIQLISSDIGISLLGQLAGQEGWLKVGSNDVNLGEIQLIWQWGTIDFTPYTGGLVPNPFPFNFPIAFPNAIWAIAPYWVTNDPVTKAITAIGNDPLTVMMQAPLQTQGNNMLFNFNRLSSSTILGPYVTGIGWAALGS